MNLAQKEGPEGRICDNYYSYIWVSESDTEKQKDDIIWAKIGATTSKMKQVWEKGGTSGKKR